MNLFTLLILLFSTAENVIKILIRNNNIKINNRYIYEIRIYKSLQNIAEIQFSRKYGREELNVEISEFKNIEVSLDLKSKREIMLAVFCDIDEIVL